MTYEEYLKEFKKIIDKTIFDYNKLCMEKEDMYQEAYLLLFQKLDKLESLPDITAKAKYFKACLVGHFKGINIKEHKNMLRNTITSFKDDDDDCKDIFDVVQKSDIEYQYTDEFLEHITAVKRECDKRWRENNRERCREHSKNYYYRKGKAKRQESDIKEHLKLYKHLWYQKNKEHVIEYNRKYRQENLESARERERQYYQEHKEEISKRRSSEKYKEKRKQYYQEHKDEINRRKRELRALKRKTQ